MFVGVFPGVLTNNSNTNSELDECALEWSGVEWKNHNIEIHMVVW